MYYIQLRESIIISYRFLHLGFVSNITSLSSNRRSLEDLEERRIGDLEDFVQTISEIFYYFVKSQLFFFYDLFIQKHDELNSI